MLATLLKIPTQVISYTTPRDWLFHVQAVEFQTAFIPKKKNLAGTFKGFFRRTRQ